MLIRRHPYISVLVLMLVVASLAIGLLAFHPVYINVCDPGYYGAPQKCEPRDALYVAFIKISTVLMHAGFWTAIATIAIAAFTWTLKKSTDNLWLAAKKQRLDDKAASDRQFEITQESIKLARDEFISTHRPKIILREAYIGSVLEGEPISIFFCLANVGETNGRIIYSIVRAEIVPRQARFLLHESVETKYDLGEIALGPGAALSIKFEGETPKWELERYREKSMQIAPAPGYSIYRDATIHFFGQFIYTDQTGIWRRTAFRRQLIPERQRFYRLEPPEPDMDYAD